LLQKLLEPDLPSPLHLPELATFLPVSFTFGHLHTLVGLLHTRTKGPGAKGGWSELFARAGRVRDRGAVLHLWLYHLMGGDGAGFAPPADWRQNGLTKRLLRRAEASAQAAAKQVDSIKSHTSKARARGEACLAQLHWRLVSAKFTIMRVPLESLWITPPADGAAPPAAAPAAQRGAESIEDVAFRLKLELNAERAASDDLAIQLKFAQTEARRALRREESAQDHLDVEVNFARQQIVDLQLDHYARAPPAYARGSRLARSSPPSRVPPPVPCRWPSTSRSARPRATPSARSSSSEWRRGSRPLGRPG
jgi:hypothetical protein